MQLSSGLHTVSYDLHRPIILLFLSNRRQSSEARGDLILPGGMGYLVIH